jgi:Xaa-Pro aminopeptidase
MDVTKNKLNPERIDWIREALQAANLDGLICSLPANILLVSGYWPVVGSALAVATREGQVVVIAPEDEQELAEKGWAAQVMLFQPSSLSKIPITTEAVKAPLAEVIKDLGLSQGRIGYEGSDLYEPASYASMHLYGPVLPRLLAEALPQAKLSDATQVIINLRARMTPFEIARVRAACQVAGMAYEQAVQQLKAGLRETQVAAMFEAPLSVEGVGYKGAQRAGGYAFCMSGPNSALAGGAYARTRQRILQKGDLILLHINSYQDGYWTDITRNYCLGDLDQRQGLMFEAMYEARAAALETIKPGVRAAEVDRAARDTLTRHGFGENFTHSTGHNVGFAAISFNGPPRLHPASPDTLEEGMVFNVEPAIYIKGYGGIRHCDVVAITGAGAEVLTPFQGGFEHIVH